MKLACLRYLAALFKVRHMCDSTCILKCAKPTMCLLSSLVASVYLSDLSGVVVCMKQLWSHTSYFSTIPSAESYLPSHLLLPSMLFLLLPIKLMLLICSSLSCISKMWGKGRHVWNSRIHISMSFHISFLNTTYKLLSSNKRHSSEYFS